MFKYKGFTREEEKRDPMAPVQRLMMYVTPIWLLNIMCRVCPKTAIGLLCHWINEKNPDFEERPIAKRRINPVPAAKKCSFPCQASYACSDRMKASEILCSKTLRAERLSIWCPLPYILLELIFDLVGKRRARKNF